MRVPLKPLYYLAAVLFVVLAAVSLIDFPDLGWKASPVMLLSLAAAFFSLKAVKMLTYLSVRGTVIAVSIAAICSLVASRISSGTSYLVMFGWLGSGLLLTLVLWFASGGPLELIEHRKKLDEMAQTREQFGK